MSLSDNSFLSVNSGSTLDVKIKLDLDDGVKLNYDQFGILLAEVKVITGNNPGMSLT